MMDTLLLVEDDAPTREWLEHLLLSTGAASRLQACSTLAQALAWLEHQRPDVVLTDLGLPDGSGLEVIRASVARYPRCEVLVLSIFGDETNVVAALDAGAGGYLLKDGSAENIREHLACLRDGGSPLSPSIARTLINRHRATPKHEAPPGPAATAWPGGTPSGPVMASSPALSEREIEVLTGVAKGFSYAEVAQMLSVSTNTVRTHIRRLYEKLSVNSRSEALMEFNRRRSTQGLPPIC